MDFLFKNPALLEAKLMAGDATATMAALKMWGKMGL